MSTKNTNAARLRALMSRKKLTRKAVAELAGVSVKAVDTWLAPPGAASHRDMPDRAMKLVALQLLQQSPKGRKWKW